MTRILSIPRLFAHMTAACLAASTVVAQISPEPPRPDKPQNFDQVDHDDWMIAELAWNEANRNWPDQASDQITFSGDWFLESKQVNGDWDDFEQGAAGGIYQLFSNGASNHDVVSRIWGCASGGMLDTASYSESWDRNAVWIYRYVGGPHHDGVAQSGGDLWGLGYAFATNSEAGIFIGADLEYTDSLGNNISTTADLSAKTDESALPASITVPGLTATFSTSVGAKDWHSDNLAIPEIIATFEGRPDNAGTCMFMKRICARMIINGRDPFFGTWGTTGGSVDLRCRITAELWDVPADD